MVTILANIIARFNCTDEEWQEYTTSDPALTAMGASFLVEMVIGCVAFIRLVYKLKKKG